MKILNEKERMRFRELARSSNASKTDEEFKEWQELNRKIGAPIPAEKNRYSTQRALHDKEDD